MRLTKTNGLMIELDGIKLGLDSSNKNADYLFMSHAHMDHIVKGGLPVITSELTEALARHRSGISYKTIHEHPLMNMLDSGHVIGSKSLLISGKSERVLYTGDFITNDRFFLKGLKPVKCDTLIMETTYGIPCYDFPKPEQIISAARDTIIDDLARGLNVALVGYALGKAQILTKIADGLGGDIFAHESVIGINELCAKHGFNIKVPKKLSKNSNGIYITTNLKDSEKIPNARAYSFTGWATGRGFESRSSFDFVKGLGGSKPWVSGSSEIRDCNKLNCKQLQGCTDCFPLSDHAGFIDLLRFVKECRPDNVLTHHGFSEEFAQLLRAEGINAKSI